MSGNSNNRNQISLPQIVDTFLHVCPVVCSLLLEPVLCSRFCNQLDRGRGCLLIMNLTRRMQESRIQEDWSSRVSCEMKQCLAERWINRQRPDVCYIGSNCWQKHVTIISFITDSEINEYHIGVNQLWHDWHHQRLTQCRRFAATSFFSVALVIRTVGHSVGFSVLPHSENSLCDSWNSKTWITVFNFVKIYRQTDC